MQLTIALCIAAFSATIEAQKACSNTLAPSTGAPVVAEGFTARVLVNGIYKARGMVSDKEGNLLVVSASTGVIGLKLNDQGGGCVTVAQKVTTIADTSLNHGIALSPDGKTLFASSLDAVKSWPYDANTMTTTGPATTWISGMTNADHSSRTLLIPKSAPNTLLVSRGSSSNMDNKAKTITTGISQIRAFDISTPKKYAYTDGKVLGWGLRNSVGLGENPTDGGIWSNENGSDSLKRDGVDIHEESPGEEINFHGFLNGTANPYEGKNYGYPICAASWNVKGIPVAKGAAALTIGRQFSYAGSAADAECDPKQYQPPRLTLPSHWAPIDIAFNSKGSVAYMTSRGSWNKKSPDGYKLFAISFSPATGQPIHPASSTTAARPILSNPDLSKCPSGCFRPTGVTFDGKGNLYMASDRSREIYVIGRTDGKSVDEVTLETQPPPQGLRMRNLGEGGKWAGIWSLLGRSPMV